MFCEEDTYKSIAEPTQGLYKESGSRFIAFAYPIETEEEVKEQLALIRKEYHDARHHCCAFRIGDKGQIWRASDDGEPSGSAGRPILGQIDASGLSDIAVIVVRYFGGIKLGIPGLIRAYKTATADALSNAQQKLKIAGKWLELSFGYDALPSVMKLVKELELPQRAQDFGLECKMEVFVRNSKREDFLERIHKLGNFIAQ